MKTATGVILCTLLAVVNLCAQTSTGALSGSITDSSGAVIGGASVTATDPATGVTVTAKTTEAGLYSFPNLPPGTYTVRANFTGFKTSEKTGVAISVSSTTNLDLQLTIGEHTESVTVKGGQALLQTSTSSVSSTVQSQLVENLPLEVSGTIRNPVQFLTLVPGFVGSVSNDPGSNNSDDYKLNGGQEGGTDILVDGVSISLVSPNTQENKGISPEAVREFTVLQSNFSAQYGESGDSIVNLSVKSGSNQLHGSAYDYLRNRVLDASSWTNNTGCNGAASCPKPLDTQNDFGALLSGPVVLPKIYDGRNKTFFMGDYEGFRFSTSSAAIYSYPTEAFRKGDFSAQSNVLLFDPITHAQIPETIWRTILTSRPAPS